MIIYGKEVFERRWMKSVRSEEIFALYIKMCINYYLYASNNYNNVWDSDINNFIEERVKSVFGGLIWESDITLKSNMDNVLLAIIEHIWEGTRGWYGTWCGGYVLLSILMAPITNVVT